MLSSYLRLFRNLLAKFLILLVISLLFYYQKDQLWNLILSIQRAMASSGNIFGAFVVGSTRSLRNMAMLLAVTSLVSLRLFGLTWTLAIMFALLWLYVIFQYLA